MEVEKYVAFLLGSSEGVSCTRAGEVLNVSHDAINRFLIANHWSGKDLFDRAAPCLVLSGGTLTVDDSVIDKPYSSLEANELVGFHWSGKHHKTVRGVNLVALLYTDVKGLCLPVNFCLFDARSRQSKHELMQQMVREVQGWGLHAKWFTADSWYSSLENLKFLRSQGMGFMVGLKSNRTVSLHQGEYQQVGMIDPMAEEGLMAHLKGFGHRGNGFIKLFRTVAPNGDARHYAVYDPQSLPLESTAYQTFEALKLIHWNVECMFRALKQFCSMERFFVRKKQAVQNHVFCALRGFQRLANLVYHEVIESVGALRKIIYREALRAFIADFA